MMMRNWRILYVGPLWEGTTCLQRMKTLRELGHYVYGIDTELPQVQVAQPSLINRIYGKLYRNGFYNFRPKHVADLNAQIIKQIKQENWDIIWIDKGLNIEVGTLHEVKLYQPNCKIVGYSPDDMAAHHNQSRQFLACLPYYDIYFTTKSYNVEELKSLGCKNVAFIGNAYDRYTHRPIPVSTEARESFGGPVGFIGAYEKERAAFMYFLASHSIPIRVWGGASWKNCRLKDRNLIIEMENLWGDDYALATCAFDIALCFLRKINRDLQTTRTMEIPACGTFMLAERTNEHLALFEEGKEAEFFSSDEELLDKVRYYLNHPEERKRIAAAGRERCIRSGYSNHDRLTQMLDIVANL